jgi:hypothetical protein
MVLWENQHTFVLQTDRYPLLNVGSVHHQILALSTFRVSRYFLRKQEPMVDLSVERAVPIRSIMRLLIRSHQRAERSVAVNEGAASTNQTLVIFIYL